jgi:hypothetical protein
MSDTSDTRTSDTLRTDISVSGQPQIGVHSDGTPDEFAVQIADSVQSFLLSLPEIAKGDEPASAISLLLLEVSQLLLTGGRLGAIEDVVPDDRYEADTGPDADEDELRRQLAELLAPIDVYHEVFDPYGPPEKPLPCRISDDLAEVVTELRHGMAHYREGRISEALWWWQYSYLATWGSTATSVLRALQSLVAHVRMDSPISAPVDGTDTDHDGLTDEQLEQQAGDLMAAELASELGI